MADARYEERTYRRMPGEGSAYGRPISSILTDLLQQFTMLIKQEGELARTELSENISRAIMGVAMAVAAAVLLVPALVILLLAAVYGLETTGLASYWSALAIGGGTFLLGLIILAIGMARLKAKSLMPNKTIHQLQEDAAMARRQVQTEPVVVETATVRRRDADQRAA
jgi:hypothetical protein